MKKWIALVLAAVTLLSLTACSGGGKKTDPKEDPDLTPAQIEAAVAKAIGDGYNATVDVPEEELWSCALRDADLTKLESYVAKQSTVPSLYQDSVVIAKCADAAYADELVPQFNEYFNQILNYNGMYPMEPHKIVGARIYRAGSIVMFIIAGASPDGSMDDAQMAALAAEEYEKIDGAIKDLLGYLPENLAVEEPPEEGSGESATYDGDTPVVGG